MTANGSSVNIANIITALGYAFKDPSGATLPNERLATILIQYVNQLNDLDKQGKLNQQQIMPGMLMIPSHIQSCSYLSTGRIKFCRLATGLCRQARPQTRDDDKTGAWKVLVLSIPFLSHSSSLHGTAWSSASRFLCSFIDCTYASPPRRPSQC